MAFEPYVRRFWPTAADRLDRLLSGHVRDPLVGRDILVGAAAGTIAALLIASREFIPAMAGLKLASPGAAAGVDPARLPLRDWSRRSRRCAAPSTSASTSSASSAFLKIVVRRTWLVVLLGVVVIIPIAMNGDVSSASTRRSSSASSIGGISLILGVLLRFGLLALIVTFYTFMAMEALPLTTDLSRPYASSSVLLVLALVAVAAYGFYASRGDEPLFGRPLLD